MARVVWKESTLLDKPVRVRITIQHTGFSLGNSFMTITYPKAEQLSIGYDPKEDRLILIVHLQTGEIRKALITRRLLSRILDRMKNELSSTHPAADRSPDLEEVLQMEHVAAMQQDKSESSSGESGAGSPPAESYLVIESQIVTQDKHLLWGLIAENKNPIAGIELARGEAHQVLRMLVEQAEKAEWGLEKKAAWMKPIRYGRGGN